MNIDQSMPLLGGLSPAQFMRRHWQKKPLVVRQALPGVTPPATRAELARLAASEDVESRLVTAFDGVAGKTWAMRQGPLAKLPRFQASCPRDAMFVFHFHTQPGDARHVV